MNRRVLISILAVALCASGAWAAEVNYRFGNATWTGEDTLTFPIQVQGDVLVLGANFIVQVDTGLGTANPVLSSVDFLTATDSMWTAPTSVSHVEPDPLHPGAYPQFGTYAVLSEDPTHGIPVPAGDGHGGWATLATVSINTAGMANGTQFTVTVLDLLDDPDNDTTLVGVDAGYVTLVGSGPATFTVPEPISMSILGLGALGMLIRRRRR